MENTRPQTVPHLCGIKIMVVDDEPDIGEILTRFLGQKGYEVVSFTEGRKALEYLKSNPVHLVLTDINMLEMNGAEVIRSARELKPGISFLVMGSRLGTGEIEQDLAGLGFLDYIHKPFELAAIAKAIEQKLAAARPAINT